jgi:hypothetical protein
MNFERFVDVFLIVCLNQVNLSMFSSLLMYIYVWTLWIFVFIVVDMNGIGECFIYCLLLWMDSLNVFLIIGWNEWNLCMFFHYLLTWMESVNVFTLCLCKCNLWMLFYDFCLYEWNMWMFSLWFVFYKYNLWMFSSSFVYINGIFGCFVRRLFIWMEYVNVFLFVCLYRSKVLFNCKFIWIEHMCIFFIPCLNESTMWMFPLMLAYMCFSCVDLDSVQVSFIKIAQGFVGLSKYRTYISTYFCHHFFPYILFVLFIHQFIGLSE